MPKVSQLPADAAPTSTDYLIALDMETMTLKKVLVSELFAEGLIPTAGLANGAVTAAKIETQQSWVAPTMLNSWVNYDSTYSPCGYMKDSLGFVHLRGLVKSGTITAAIFTLPAGYRPEYQSLFDTQSNAAVGRVDVLPNGNVVANSGNNAWISLEGITFKAYA